jgi:phage tail-like protein
MTVIGNPRSFHKKFKFVVEIDDVGHAGFQKASELSVEVANVQYFEGGSLIPNKSPGRLTFSDVTLERGATQDRDLFDWFQDVAITSSGLGLTDVNYKRNLDIVQQDRDGLTLRRWSLSRAWPVKFVAGEWDNESDENIIESVTLTYDFFELGAVTRSPATARNGTQGSLLWFTAALSPSRFPGGFALVEAAHGRRHHVPFGAPGPRSRHEGARGARPRGPQARQERRPGR